MSYLSDASLVMIPSGVEAGTVFTSKPAGGSADLTFTRSNDTATRVGPNGYIEKVRTNLALYSQDFSQIGTWVPRNGTYTANAGTAPDGTNTATKVTATNIDPYIYQSISFNGVITASCYMKGIGSSIGKNAQVRIGAIPTTIALTSNWQRVSVTTTISGATICGVEVPDPAIIGDEAFIWGFQVEAGTVATDYIPTTTAAVSVGPLANVPRINFDPVLPRTGSLLLEPQRTNLIPYSEYIADSGWTKTNATATTNYAISPDGYKNATLISFTSGGFIVESVTTTKSIGGQETISIFSNSDISGTFLKYGGGTAAGTDVEGREAIGNGWFRYYVTRTFTEAETGLTQVIVAQSNVGDNVILWGAQIEQGGYPTSYIPTYGAAVTRGADACSKTGIGSLIGQTEGTLYWEGKIIQLGEEGRVSLSDGTQDNRLWIRLQPSGSVLWYGRLNTINDFNIQSLSDYSIGDTIKVAATYAANDFKLYINGVEQGTDTTYSTSGITLNKLDYGRYNGNDPMMQLTKQLIVFPTALTPVELATLTTL